MKNLQIKKILVLTAMVIASSANGQFKKAEYTTSQEMLLNSASEQKLYVQNYYKGFSFGLAGVGLLSLAASMPKKTETGMVDRVPLYMIGGILAASGIFHTIKAPIHLKRSAAYLEASVTGVRISF